MKFISTPKNIFQVVRPFYYFLRVFGLFPCSFDGDIRHGIFSFKIRDKIVLTIFLIFYILLSLSPIFKTPYNGSHVSHIAWKAVGFSGHFTVIFAIIYGFQRRNSFVHFLKICHKFDLKVCIQLKL